MNGRIQLNQDGILYTKIVEDEFADEISLMELRMGSLKRTTLRFKNGPCIGSAASLGRNDHST